MKQKKQDGKLLALIKHLKQAGKSEAEIQTFLKGVARLSALDLYTAMMLGLDEEDLAQIEAMKDEKKAEKLAAKLFQQRTGMTVEELAERAQEGFAEGYLAASGGKG